MPPRKPRGPRPKGTDERSRRARVINGNSAREQELSLIDGDFLPEPHPDDIHHASKFKIGYCKKTYEYLLMGWDEKDIAEAFGINPSNFRAWRQQYPEFDLAIRKATEETDLAVVRSLKKKALGFSVATEKIFCTKDGDIKRVPTRQYIQPDQRSIEYWLNNKSGGRWSSTVKQEVTGKDGAPLIPEEGGTIRDKIARKLTGLANRTITHTREPPKG